MPSRVCVVCEKETKDDALQQGSVHSNVRAFWAERFAYFRCAHCGSLHAEDEVDLAHYYARYPFHDLPTDPRLELMYGNFLARLRRGGLDPSHRILDYGCGGGRFVRFLEQKGFRNVRGFDEYSAEFGDRSVLEGTYDCVVSQDVIEHVASPQALLTEFSRLVAPSGLVVIGTPNAAAIDLGRSDEFVHTIHAPYHRHILSKAALLDAGARQGWKLGRFYPTMYSNTRIPFLNERFYLFYSSLTDGTLDAIMEPIRVGAVLLRAPVALFWGLFGSFFSRGTDVMAVFKR